jgi:hypothetical protein
MGLSTFVMRMQIRIAGRRQIDSYHPDSVAQAKDARGPKVISMVAPFYNLVAIGIIVTPVLLLSSFYCIETTDERRPDLDASLPP